MNTTNHQSTVSRREILTGASVACVATATLGVNRPAAGAAAAESVHSGGVAAASAAPVAAPVVLDRATAALLGPLVGESIDRWRVVAVHATRSGGIPVVLETRAGVQFQVDILRRDASATATNGVATTQSLAVAVHNTGNGSVATVEEQGLGAMALAAALSARETAGVPVPQLLTFAERAQMFPNAVLDVRG